MKLSVIMKKVLYVALAVLVSASFSTVSAKEKKEKKQKVVTVQPVELKSDVDSVAYAIGMMQTNGLKDYLVSQMKVDTAYMADFIEGLKEMTSGKIDAQKTAFYAGIQIGQQVANQMMKGINQQLFGADTTQTISLEKLMAGFITALVGDKGQMTMEEAQGNAHRLTQQIKDRATDKLYGANREAGRKFLAENKLKEGVITTASGLQYKVLKQGEGAVPQRTDKVKVHYEGRLVDGTVFDASSKHGSEPISFRADQVIKGWTEALTMMPVGSKWQLFIPYELAYGERNSGMIKPYSALIFDVELVDIEK
jgi:FKBP-type peptidyl-prolyl cis-trans isomerase FklB